MTTIDPTAIPIHLDPTEQRMNGIAVHGNTPFNVAYVTPITDDLWTGGCANGFILPSKVKHVISLYPWEKYKNNHQLKSFLSVWLYDDLEGPDTEQIVGIARWVNVCRGTGITLVHCQAGLNRSGMVAAVALMLGGHTADSAIELLRTKRSSAVLCNPSFVHWLRELNIKEHA